MILTTRTCFRRVFLVIPLFLLCTILMAANNQPGEKITLNERATPLKKVFNKITSQTGIKFVYSNRLIDDQQPVSVSVREATLEEALQQIFIGRRFEVQRPNPKSVVLVVHEKITERKMEVIPASKKSDNAFFDITGTVTDTAGASIPGATVLVRGTNKATATDANGQFSLQGIQQNMTLLVSSIGFQTREVRLGNNTDINVKLSAAVNNLDESVIVAYGATTQRENVGSVTTIKGEEIQTLPNRSFDRSLQGLVPGLQITKGTGQPGGGLSNMVIRGISSGSDVSFGQTVRNPLIVIDGIPVTQDNFQFAVASNTTPISNPLAQLNTSDIETISVLKDAAAIALYGSKASNGIILITTKRGKIGKTTFGFRHQTDIASKLLGKIEVLNQQEYLGLIYETYRNTNSTLWTDQAILADLKNKFPTKPDGNFYPTPDWNSELYTDHATTVANEISMSGGNEKSNFYLNLEYTKQNGVVKRTGYDRKSLRFNFEHRPMTWLKIGINSTFSYNKQDYTNYAESASSYATAMIISPLNPIRLMDGSYKLIYTQGATSSTLANPIAAAEYNINKNIAYRGLSNIFGEVRLLKYLTLKSNLGVDFMLAELKEKNDPRFYTTSTPPRISERDSRRINLISTNTLKFDKNINYDHIVNFILGQEAQINTEKTLGAEATGTAETSPYFDQLNSSGYTMNGITGSNRKQTLLSLFAQGNYSFKNKYFLSTSIRRDGSSKFGDQQQWGTYWSIGGGWIITGERFMKNQLVWMDYLKLRGSFGAAGSSGAVDDLTRFDMLTRYKYLNANAVRTLSPGNPDIRWEQTFTWDAGLESRFLKERISFTVDIYKRKTRDLIYTTNLPSLTGFSTTMANIGNMENQGVELSLSTRIIRSKTFRWNLNANWSSNQNILVKANVPLVAISGGILGNEEGRNFNSFYMPIWAGVNPADGKPQWLDNAGKPTSDYSLAKKEFVGKPQPDGYGAITNTFSFRGFDLSAQLYYQYGVKIYDASLSFPLQSDGLYPYINQIKQTLDYWKKPGDIATNPRRLLSNTDRGNSASTRYLFKGDYIRLSNVTVSYIFPKKILDKIRLSMLKVYLQGNNLALLTNYPGPDPDNANVGGSTKFGYPNQKAFSFGLHVNF